MFHKGAVLQKTLKAPIHCTGVGLHSGVKAAITLRPAPANTGIVFRRLDVEGAPVEIPADWRRSVESALCTPLTDDKGISIMTVEHLMSALAGCAIDNAIIDIIGPEVPIMDGSAAPFVFLIECAGTIEQLAPRRFVKVLKPVRIEQGQASVTLAPGEGFSVDFTIDFASKAIARQSTRVTVDPGTFKSEISRARTFGFLAEVDQLRAAGLARGGSLDNAIVIDGDEVLNDGGLRYPDEFVRHKALDAIGDLYLAGNPLIGRFEGIRSSHALNRRALEALFADDEAWCYVTLADAQPIDAWQEPARATA
ncbi:UDP-3-O-acyl-N-acetylglucosamine deacetylase [Aliidongia dinghuensis]|uniref:UDP-3-O-acyl-N-acetylglucosamine deacetylase n=1 Tax=Aliidongia dinghuensis TaxID=1867774 RepID=A0A8J2YTW6_9PROT|nr:UDP-3-O-acyl-N-acetylglucosamine deacetylase [Aliidongia dinghuensis]GGF17408.1 UDP-3-O-acyl-N-acetylglucosamine deacetylase [Aliidongia dinghuensis]